MKTAFVNGIILDGTKDMEPISGKILLVNGEKIEKITDSVPEGYEKVDLQGAYITPGLINLHVHIPANGKPKKKATDYGKLAKLLKSNLVLSVFKKMCANYVKDELYAGVTTIRAVGGIFHFDTELRDKINAGKAVGPRILAADYAVSVPGGHMTGTVALPANSVEEAVKMVEDLAAHKVDHIKLMITGGVLDAIVPGEPGILKMPREYVKACCDKAHELGLKVAAHVEGTEGMEIALECGVDTIEHGGKPNEKTTALFVEKKAALISTLSPVVPFVCMDPSVSHASEVGVINGNALLKFMVEGIKACREQGVEIGLGTDVGCPYSTHYDMWRELFWFQKYIGADAKECLYRATGLNAKIAGIDNITGTIAEGKSADFLVLPSNPLEDVSVFREPSAVYFKGSKVKGKPKKFEEVETELDKIMAKM